MARRKEFRFEDALGLVTGAGNGIGRAIALSLAQRGARVVAVDIDGEAAEKTAAACGERGPDAAGFACDVADAAAVLALAEQVHETWGPLDVLVNNAGVALTGRWTETTVDDWAWIRGVNLDGVAHGCHAFGPAMLDRGHGHVVNVSSILGYWPHALVAGYVTTKAGILALSQCLRADWGSQGVGVSVVCPGGVNTSLIDRTRFRGKQAGESRAVLDSTRHKARSPDVVAHKVVKAIDEDRPFLPIGWEASLAWQVRRFLPVRLQGLAARAAVR